MEWKMKPLVTSIPRAGRALGLGRYAAYEAARRGQLPTIELGRRKVVPVRALEEMLGLEPGSLTEADLADPAADAT